MHQQAESHKIATASRKFFNRSQSLGIFGAHHKRPSGLDLEPGAGQE